MSPLVGARRPSSIFIVVDLPEPFGAEEAVDLPGRNLQADTTDYLSISVLLGQSRLRTTRCCLVFSIAALLSDFVAAKCGDIDCMI